MKKGLLLVWLVVMSLGLLSWCKKKVDAPLAQEPAQQQTTKNPWVKDTTHRYQIPAATIVYQYSGMQHGTETLVFDTYGARESKTASLSMNIGWFSDVTNTVSLYLDGNIISYDVDERSGTKIIQPEFLQELAQEASATNKDLAELGIQMLQDMWGVQEGTKDILGITCDVWKIDQLWTTACLWKWLLFESRVEFAGQSQTITATSFTQWSVDPGVFVIPDDIDFSASESAQQVMNQFFDAETSGQAPAVQ